MNDTLPAAKSTGASDAEGCGKADVAGHLANSLRDYFALAEQMPLPDRLSALVERFETALAANGEQLAETFRDNLIRALPSLRTFAMSLCANGARADDLVQETLIKACASRTRFAPSTNFTA